MNKIMISTKRDGELAKRIEIALNGNIAVDTGKISVEVVGTDVLIRGQANTFAEKIFIEEEISAVPGVTKVINDIEVHHSTLISDIGIAGHILQCLSLCLRLDLSAVFVKVCNGIVFLRGAVPTPYCRTRAGALAGKIPQVVAVINELQVVPRQAK